MRVHRLDHLTTEPEKRVTQTERRIEILRYLSDRQITNQKTTKNDVIKHMKGKSSRETTHNIIMELIREGKLNVEVLNSQLHFLTVKEEYDLPQYERELLIKAITETHSYFDNVVIENDALVSFVKEVIDNNDIRYVRQDYLDIPREELLYKVVTKGKTRRKTKPKKH